VPGMSRYHVHTNQYALRMKNSVKKIEYPSNQSVNQLANLTGNVPQLAVYK